MLVSRDTDRGNVAAAHSAFGVELLSFYFFFSPPFFVAGTLCVCAKQMIEKTVCLVPN